ncbi:MAG: response regulator [Treponemataceae bacterium]|nr:response regulator [Treponemataceae bacterium]
MKHTILIADDERIIREGIAARVAAEFEGTLTVLTATNGIDALEKIRAHNGMIDIVLADIVMPEMDGLTLIETCRNNEYPIECIILSSYDDFSYAQQAIRNRVCEYVLKPADDEQIFEVIRKVLQKIDTAEKTETMQRKSKEMMLVDFFTNPAPAVPLLELLQIKNEEYRLFCLPHTKKSLSATESSSVVETVSDYFWGSFVFYENDNLFVYSPVSNDITATKAESFLHSLKIPETTAVPLVAGSSSRPQNAKEEFEKIDGVCAVISYFTGRDLVYADSVSLVSYSQSQTIEQLSNSVLQSVTKLEASAAKEAVTSIIDECRKNRFEFNSVKHLFFSLYFSIVEQSKKLDAETISSFQPMTGIEQARSIEQLCAILEEGIDIAVKNNAKSSIHQYPKQVRKVIEYVEEHYADYELSLLQISTQAVFMNQDYLGKLFHKETGQKFSQYLLNLRIEKAKEFLRDVDLSINDIADKTGFAGNPSYFSRVFHKVTGLSPSEYRNSL